jgi:hypothetical protein
MVLKQTYCIYVKLLFVIVNEYSTVFLDFFPLLHLKPPPVLAPLGYPYLIVE